MSADYRIGQLEGDWAVFARIAGYLLYRVPAEDRKDWLDDTLIEMARVKAKYEVIGKPLTEAGLMRVAQYELKGYWAKRIYRLYGVNCTNCSREERTRCRTIDKSQCPKGKAITILRLNKVLMDGDGDDGRYELGDIVPDKNSMDLAAWVDARQTLRCLSKRLKQVGYKYYAGYSVNNADQKYIAYRRHCKEAREAQSARVFIYDGRRFPDPDPALTPDEVRRLLAGYFPELANAGVCRNGSETIFELVRRPGTKGITYCKRGHPYNEANTLVDARGYRTCRICHNESCRRYREKHRERALARNVDESIQDDGSIAV